MGNEKSDLIINFYWRVVTQWAVPEDTNDRELPSADRPQVLYYL
jgi:hypothetical protein